MVTKASGGLESLPLESKLFEGVRNFKTENLKRTILILEK